MKRGLQTALMTGGLLAAGAGTASADDSTAVTVPVTVTDNAFALADTGLVLPDVTATVQLGIDPGASTAPAAPEPDGLDVAVPVTVTGNAVGVLGDAAATGSPEPAPESDVSVPVTLAGNGVGVLGDAGGSAAPAPTPAPARDDGGLLDADAPVTVCGIGAGVLGDGSGSCTTAPAAATGDSGTTDPLVDADAPVTVCGIGAGVLGDGSGSCTTAPATPPTSTDGSEGTPSRESPQGTGSPAVEGDLLTLGIPAMTAGPVTDPLPVGTTDTVGTVGTGRQGVVPAGSSRLDPAAARQDGNGTGISTVAEGDDRLAYTGSELAVPLLAGLLALLLGSALAVSARRRTTTLR